ncbi:MAG: hypothetical protein AVDCRST_MAG66-4029, partial [uncultured Pseudonocardia sp.]
WTRGRSWDCWPTGRASRSSPRWCSGAPTWPRRPGCPPGTSAARWRGCARPGWWTATTSGSTGSPRPPAPSPPRPRTSATPTPRSSRSWRGSCATAGWSRCPRPGRSGAWCWSTWCRCSSRAGATRRRRSTPCCAPWPRRATTPPCAATSSTTACSTGRAGPTGAPVAGWTCWGTRRPMSGASPFAPELTFAPELMSGVVRGPG